MKKFKELNIEAKDFKIEDIVINKKGNEFYVITYIGTSSLHKHEYFKCIYNKYNAKKRYYFHEIIGKRRVLRFV